MVSSPHEAMHRIFQEHPSLFSRLSEVLGIDTGPCSSADVMPTDLTESQPLERRVDTLLRIETEDGSPFLLAVEAQGRKDPEKPATWAYYYAHLLNKYRMRTLLLVVCQNRSTAEWAARPTHFGSPEHAIITLRPLVVGPHNMPVITEVAAARKDPAFTTLALITHADDPDIGAILKTLSTALRDTPEAIANPLVELTAQGLGNRPAARQWRNLVAMDLSFYTSPLSEEIRDEGRAKGRAEDILRLLELRGIAVPVEARDKIAGCHDLHLLDRWFSHAVTATTAEDVFTEE
ncbi:hypothetical protein ACFWBV_01280 [Streptomyces sp. NPDC060030]|uniref:hypothetical protein n=1 Tax=Streptomyces sp. NPDC060030 TaxID=3347042 RepID=UPI00369002F7